jgi:hypothetical protein
MDGNTTEGANNQTHKEYWDTKTVDTNSECAEGVNGDSSSDGKPKATRVTGSVKHPPVLDSDTICKANFKQKLI